MKKPQNVFHNYITTNYSSILSELKKCNQLSKLEIDYTCLNEYFQKELKHNFFDYDNYNKIISDVEKQINTDNTVKNWISIKIVDMPPNCILHDLNSTYVGDIVSTKAMVKNITEPNPTLKSAVYECRSCMRLIKVDVHDNIVNEPTLCPDCAGKSFKFNQELSEFRDYRYVKLEEPLELRTGGNTREFKGYMQDFLASPQHNLKAGDVVDIIGDFKVNKTDKNNKKKDFEYYLDLHNIKPVDNAWEDFRLTDEDKKEIIKLSKTKNIYSKLVNSLAPEIVGYETVKEGLLLQLFEGYRPAEDKFKHENIDRWTIHILLIGDPGIGKSQLITALKQRVPKIIDINGADTSQAGLTTSAVKDELTGAWTLEAGAVVLADTGVLCIDEFDKLNKSTQKSLNQAMEQLTVSGAKAGLVRNMSARTSIVACANPKYSRFNPYKSIKEQINIPDSTLSRFDLVFALNDVIEEEHDNNLANALLNMGDLVDESDVIDIDLFKKYITFAKMEIFPTLNEDAKQLLVDFYVKTRQAVKTDDSSKPITARDLKAIERLTIARAKTELRETATIDDAKCAIRIYNEALKTVGLTPETAGELESVLSNAEIKLVTDTENMILAKMNELDTNKITNDVLKPVKHELGVLCHGLGFNRDVILENAIKNIKNLS